MVVVVLICGMTIISINDRSTRKDELEYAVSAAVQQSVKMCHLESGSIGSEEMMKTVFIQNLCTNIQSEGSIEVSFYGIDYKQGLLDVEVTEKFEYPGGNKGSITVRKAAIYE